MSKKRRLPQYHLLLFALLGAVAAPRPVPAQPRNSLRPDPLAYVSPSRDVDVVHTRVDLDLDVEAGRIAGSVTHTLRALKPGLRQIRLNCVALEVSEAAVGGERVEFEYPVSSDLSTSWIDAAQTRGSTDELVVHLPESPAIDAEVELTVTYSGSPTQGLYFIRPEKGVPEKRYEVWAQGEGADNRYWIPCFDYPNDKATYEGIYRVDKGMTVISNGALVEQRDIGNKTQFHWRLATPQVSYLITVAASTYRIIEDKWRDVPLLYVVPPGTDDETIERAYGLTSDMLEFFSSYIGIDYPFEKYAQITVQNFIYSGMENTSAAILTTRTLYDEHQEATATEQKLLAHELAHQWWGDMVTCGEWSHVWLNEGLASYYQELYRRHHEGDDAFRYEMDERHRKTLAFDKKDPRPMVVDFYNRRDERNSANVYDRGASVMHMLHFILGEELFRKSMKNYGERFKFQVAETSDLAKVIRDTTGENLDWFFEQWAYLTGHPNLRVTKSWDPEHATLRLRIEQTQKVKKLTPLFRMLMDVEITCAETTETHRVVVEAAEQDFYFNLPSNPLMVIVDKGDWTLKDTRFDKTPRELVYQLRHGDAMARVRAARAMGRTGDKALVVEALSTVLASPEEFWGLRHEAALALGRIGTEEAERALLQAAEEPNARIRKAAAMAMGKLAPSGRLDDALRGLLHDDFAYEVRAEAVTALVKMRSPSAEKVCLEALKMPSHNGSIRRAALTGLVDLDAVGAMDAVEALATPGNRRYYRHEAIASFAKLAKLLEREPDRKQAAEFLASGLDDWYLVTRRETIKALGTLGEASAVDGLRAVADTDPVESLRGLASKTADEIVAAGENEKAASNLDAKIETLTQKIESLQKELNVLRTQVSAGEDSERLSRKQGDE